MMNRIPDEKKKNCRNEAEARKTDAETGMQELSPEMLEGVSGGNQAIPPEWFMKDE